MTTELDSVMVIGDCGFLGHHIVTQILQSSPSSKISVLDSCLTHNRLQEVSYYNVDTMSAEAVLPILEWVRPKVIIHISSRMVPQNNVHLWEKINVNGIPNILKGAGEVGVKAYVYSSSALVVHDLASGLVNADESLPVLRSPQQSNIYLHTTGAVEELVLAANRQYHNLLTVSIRPAALFGEGDSQLIPYILQLYYDIKTNYETIVQLSSTKNVLDFTYVGNAAHAHILAAKKLLAESKQSSTVPANERVGGEAFFVTNDEPLEFWDFMWRVWRATDDTSDRRRTIIPKALALVIVTLVKWIFWIIFFGTKEPNLIREAIIFHGTTRTYCIDKIKTRLGYRPLVNMDEGIIRSVQWFQRQKSKEKKGQ